MSRERDQIARAAAGGGWTILRMDWEPITAGAEKSGPEGGWDIDLIRDGKMEWAGGYNVAQVVQWIKNFDLPWPYPDPFACSGKSHSLVAGDCMAYRGHRGPHLPLPIR